MTKLQPLLRELEALDQKIAAARHAERAVLLENVREMITDCGFTRLRQQRTDETVLGTPEIFQSGNRPDLERAWSRASVDSRQAARDLFARAGSSRLGVSLIPANPLLGGPACSNRELGSIMPLRRSLFFAESCFVIDCSSAFTGD